MSQDTRAIFSYDDFIWPCINLDLSLTWAPYLYRTLASPSVALQQSLGSRLSLVCSLQAIRRNSQLSPLTSPWPDIWRFEKFLRQHWSLLAESFRSPPREPIMFGSRREWAKFVLPFRELETPVPRRLTLFLSEGNRIVIGSPLIILLSWLKISTTSV